MRQILALSLVVFVTLCWIPPLERGFSQESSDDKSSRREVAAIHTIEEAGGKVYKISAADDSREISCYLSSKPIKDEHLKNIGAIRNVIWMNLAGTEITDDGLKFLAGMPLTKLHLERTGIGDNGLEHLKSMKALEYLNLYGTKVTDEGLEHLKELKKLRKLFVWQTGVTDEGMKRLNESLPDLEIVGEVKLNPVVMEEPQQETTEEKETAEKKESGKPQEGLPKKGQPEEDQSKADQGKAGKKKAAEQEATEKKDGAGRKSKKRKSGKRNKKANDQKKDDD